MKIEDLVDYELVKKVVCAAMMEYQGDVPAGMFRDRVFHVAIVCALRELKVFPLDKPDARQVNDIFWGAYNRDSSDDASIHAMQAVLDTFWPTAVMQAKPAETPKTTRSISDWPGNARVGDRFSLQYGHEREVFSKDGILWVRDPNTLQEWGEMSQDCYREPGYVCDVRLAPGAPTEHPLSHNQKDRIKAEINKDRPCGFHLMEIHEAILTILAEPPTPCPNCVETRGHKQLDDEAFAKLSVEHTRVLEVNKTMVSENDHLIAANKKLGDELASANEQVKFLTNARSTLLSENETLKAMKLAFEYKAPKAVKASELALKLAEGFLRKPVESMTWFVNSGECYIREAIAALNFLGIEIAPETRPKDAISAEMADVVSTLGELNIDRLVELREELAAVEGGAK